MMSEREARALAEAELAKPPNDYVVLITGTAEYDVGWVFFYNTKQFAETGDLQHALVGNAPILVDREDGSVHRTGTARPIEEYIERFKVRDPADERSWHP